MQARRSRGQPPQYVPASRAKRWPDLRIVHVADYVMPKLGYQETLLPVWNARHGHDVHLVTSDRFHPVPNYDQVWAPLMGPRVVGAGTSEIDGVRIHRLPTWGEAKGRPWIAGLERKVRELAPDAIFCHNSASSSALRLARVARRERIPFVVDCHMVWAAMNRGPLGRAYYAGLRALTRRVLAPSVDKFLGVTEESCDFLVVEQGAPREKVACLPLGIDTDLFRPDAEKAAGMRSAWGVPSDARVVLQTGKLSGDKAPEVLAAAMAPLLAQDPRLHLVFVGGASADDAARIRSELRDGAVDAQVHIEPLLPVGELRGAYSAADLVVYPAATSLSALEAAACARPVVMSDLPTSRWRASKGVGVCYPTGDAAALSRLLARLLGDEKEREAMGRAARDAVLREFSYDRVARECEEMLGALAKERRGET